MSKPVTIGATVRFLNAIGGGRVARITKDTAWVEDEDGFEIPTPLSECVVVEAGDTFMPKYKPPTFVHTREVEHRDTPADEPRHRLKVEDFEDLGLKSEPEEERPTRLPHTFLPAKGDFAACLAIVPQDIKRLGSCDWDWYLVNDSEYSCYYVVSRWDGKAWRLIHRGELYPDQDIRLGTIGSRELNDYERLNVQLIAFAENPGIFKEQHSSQLELDTPRLLRLNSYVDNDYYEDKAYILPLDEELKPASPTEDWASLTQRLEQHIASTSPRREQYKAQPKTQGTDEPIVVDLHIDELLDTTAGMSPADILSYQIGVFNKTMTEHLGQSGRKLIFIHGKGDGILRRKLLEELRYRYKHCTSQDASFQQYSYGATQITIGKKK